jgi:DNA-directed RNA polymerase subunit RPC12/RpoP
MSDTLTGKTSVHCQNPDCNKQYAISLKHTGKEVRCPNCGWKIHVPKPTSAPSEQEDQELKRLSQDLGSYTTGHKVLQNVLDHTEGRQAKTYAVQIAGLAAALVAIAVVIYFWSGKPWAAPTAPPPPPALGPRDLLVSVTPSYAELWLDGELAKTADAPDRDGKGVMVTIQSGEAREIEAKAEGYRPEKRRLGYSTESPIRIALKPVVKQLEITSNPSGADVLLDESPAGRTPCRAEVKMISKTATLRLQLAGYRPAQRELVLADAATETVSFDLVPTPEALAQHNWIELLKSNRMADRAAGYSQPAIQSTEPWSQDRSPETDYVIGVDGNRIAVTITTPTISLTTALGTQVIPREAIAWADLLDTSRLVVRTNLGDTMVGELVDTNIAYEAAPGTAGRIKGDQVQAMVFRSEPPGTRSDVLTTVAVAVGSDTCLGTELQGIVQLETSLGLTAVDGANIRSLRRLEEPNDHYRIDAEDGSSVSGGWAAGSLSIRLLCNDARVEMHGRPLQAIEVTPSVQVAKNVSQLDAMNQSLAAATAEVERLDQVIKGIEDENRSLVQQRRDRVNVLQAQRRDARKERRQAENAQRQRSVGIPTRTPSRSSQSNTTAPHNHGSSGTHDRNRSTRMPMFLRVRRVFLVCETRA